MNFKKQISIHLDLTILQETYSILKTPPLPEGNLLKTLRLYL